MKRIQRITGAVLLLLCMPTLSIAQKVGDASKVTTENRGTFLAVPSKPMHIWDRNRSQIWGTIVGRDENGITVLKAADRKEYHIKWDTLDPKLVPYYKGEMTLEEYEAAMKAEAAANTAAHQKLLAEKAAARTAAKGMSQAERVALMKKSEEKWREMAASYRAMSPQELQKLLRDKNPDFMLTIQKDVINHQTNEAVLYKGKSRIVWDLVSELEIKPITDEKVSLRSEFEKLGVRTQQQVGHKCNAYSLHNVFQFLVAKHGGKSPSAQELAQFNPSRYASNTESIQMFARINGRFPNMQELATNYESLDMEILKDQLRKGRPCTIDWSPNPGRAGSHQSVAVGFEVKNGKTTIEILDTNRTHIDNGYQTISGKIRPVMSFWME